MVDVTFVAAVLVAGASRVGLSFLTPRSKSDAPDILMYMETSFGEPRGMEVG
jgi:hypothetical protein